KELGFLASGPEFACGHADVGELHAGRLGGGEGKCRGRRESDEHGVDPVRVREAVPGAGINSLLWSPTAIATRGNGNAGWGCGMRLAGHADHRFATICGQFKMEAALFFSAAGRIVTKCLDSRAFVGVLVRRLMWPRGHAAFRSATQDKKAAALAISTRLAVGGHITASIIVIGVMTILHFRDATRPEGSLTSGERASTVMKGTKPGPARDLRARMDRIVVCVVGIGGVTLAGSDRRSD